jgi:hypothetical protein
MSDIVFDSNSRSQGRINHMAEAAYAALFADFGGPTLSLRKKNNETTKCNR